MNGLRKELKRGVIEDKVLWMRDTELLKNGIFLQSVGFTVLRKASNKLLCRPYYPFMVGESTCKKTSSEARE